MMVTCRAKRFESHGNCRVNRRLLSATAWSDCNGDLPRKSRRNCLCSLLHHPIHLVGTLPTLRGDHEYDQTMETRITGKRMMATSRVERASMPLEAALSRIACLGEERGNTKDRCLVVTSTTLARGSIA